jgi:hypothetical protein
MNGLGRIERTDHDVIAVGISERKFHSSSARVHMGLLFQSVDERARPGQSVVEIIDAEKQEETVARRGGFGARQCGMLVGTPPVETEQDRSIRVEDLPEVIVTGSRRRQAKKRLIPLETGGHIGDANDRPGALHKVLRWPDC